MSDPEARNRDLETYRALLELWKGENPIKTSKLQVLLAVNGGLVAVVQLNGGLVAGNRLIYIAGFVLSLVWTLSIGRTSLFQRAWRNKLAELQARYPDDDRFRILETDAAVRASPAWLRTLGGVPSKYYLVGAPCLFSVAWLAAALLV